MSVTVLVPANATALTTVDNVRTDLGLAAGTPIDAQLTRFIAQASARAAMFCRRVFGRETVRERFSAPWPCAGSGISLRKQPWRSAT